LVGVWAPLKQAHSNTVASEHVNVLNEPEKEKIILKRLDKKSLV